MSSFRRVLFLVLHPLRPSSDLMGGVQVAATVAGPLVGSWLASLFVPWWSLAWTVAAILGAVAALSLRAAYQLQRENEALLGQTPLQEVLVSKIAEGEWLLSRLKRRPKDRDVPQDLTANIVSWFHRTIRDVRAVAPELADELLAYGLAAPETHVLEDQTRCVKEMLRALRGLARG